MPFRPNPAIKTSSCTKHAGIYQVQAYNKEKVLMPLLIFAGNTFSDTLDLYISAKS
jgi:hypothetical protein